DSCARARDGRCAPLGARPQPSFGEASPRPRRNQWCRLRVRWACRERSTSDRKSRFSGCARGGRDTSSEIRGRLKSVSAQSDSTSLVHLYPVVEVPHIEQCPTPVLHGGQFTVGDDVVNFPFAQGQEIRGL